MRKREKGEKMEREEKMVNEMKREIKEKLGGARERKR